MAARAKRVRGFINSRSISSPVYSCIVTGATSGPQVSDRQLQVHERANTSATDVTEPFHKQHGKAESTSGNEQSPHREHTAPATPESYSNNDTPATSPAVDGTEADHLLEVVEQDLSDVFNSRLSTEQVAQLQKCLGESLLATVAARRWLT